MVGEALGEAGRTDSGCWGLRTCHLELGGQELGFQTPAVGIIMSRSQTRFPEAHPLFVAVIVNATICFPVPQLLCWKRR